MEGNFLQLNSIKSYKLSLALSNYIWDIVMNWDYFSKDTIGKQFVRSADSYRRNIAEGFGRYNKKDKIKFYRYSFGSVKESLDWNEKAKTRKLVKQKQCDLIFEKLNCLPKEINSLIRFTNSKLKQ